MTLPPTVAPTEVMLAASAVESEGRRGVGCWVWPAWVMVWVWLPTVIVPVRDDVVVLAWTE